MVYGYQGIPTPFQRIHKVKTVLIVALIICFIHYVCIGTDGAKAVVGKIADA